MYGLWCCTRVLEGSAYCPGIQRESDRRDCANNGGISIFSIPQKIYERVFISRVIESTNEQVVEEQGEFKSSRGCIDEIPGLKHFG